MDTSTKLENVFDLYQAFTPTTALYPGANTGNKDELLYLSLGLMGEFIEWMESGYSEKEAGDVFWYISQLCHVFDVHLSDFYTNVKETKWNRTINIPEALKKYIRDGKNPNKAVIEYMEYTIGYMNKVYSYSINNPPIEEMIIRILIKNRDKLIDRQNRNVIRGDGDNR